MKVGSFEAFLGLLSVRKNIIISVEAGAKRDRSKINIRTTTVRVGMAVRYKTFVHYVKGFKIVQVGPPSHVASSIETQAATAKAEALPHRHFDMPFEIAVFVHKETEDLPFIANPSVVFRLT